MLPIVRTAQAEEDLIAIWQYVARESEAAADRLLDRFEGRWQQLAIYPFSGPLHDIAPGLRHLIVGEYLTFIVSARTQSKSSACCMAGAKSRPTIWRRDPASRRSCLAMTRWLATALPPARTQSTDARTRAARRRRASHAARPMCARRRKMLPIQSAGSCR